MIRDQLQRLIREAITQQYGLTDRDIPHFSVVGPDKLEHGDYATNAGLILARALKKPPLEIANALNYAMLHTGQGIIGRTEVAAPGFINVWLLPQFLHEELERVLKEKERYGRLRIGEKKKILVEFISANPTGPLTVANARGGPFGDALASVLEKAGWRVTREYYINDVGAQISALGHSVLGDDKAQYRGAYIDDLRKKIKGKDPEKIGRRAASIVLKHIQNTVQKGMGIRMDVWFSERALYDSGKVDALLARLRAKDLAYEKDGALWFRATRFGDAEDRVLIKSDGLKTYFAGDFAYHENKFTVRKFDRAINIWGADHHGDILRLMAAAEVLGAREKLMILLTQFVRVVQGGKALSMSKRRGVFVTADKLLADVGRDALRFFFLMSSADTHMDFDIDLAKERSLKNPVYYVQYAHARIAGILRQRSHLRGAPDFALLASPEELGLIKKIAQFCELIEDTARDCQVHRIPRYAMELARAFHGFYEAHRVVTDDKKLTIARLALVQGTRIALLETLRILGVSAPKKM